jgi:hypothetical protein
MTSLSDSCRGGMPEQWRRGVDVDAVLAGLFELMAPHLTEKQRRLLAGAGARTLGRCDGTTGTGSGTTPCCPPPHKPPWSSLVGDERYLGVAVVNGVHVEEWGIRRAEELSRRRGEAPRRCLAGTGLASLIGPRGGAQRS